MATKKKGSIKLEDSVLVTSVSLGDINATGAAAGRTLAIDGGGTALEWIAAGGGTSFAGLTDVALVGLAGGHIAIYSGSAWVNKALSGDVTVTSGGVVTIGASKIATGMIQAGAVDLSKVGTDVREMFAILNVPNIDAESGNQRLVTHIIQDLNATGYASDVGAVFRVRVSDSAADAEPSATATIVAYDSTTMEGSGTATALIRGGMVSALYRMRFYVAETAAATRYVWIEQGFGSQKFVCMPNGPYAVTFA